MSRCCRRIQALLHRADLSQIPSEITNSAENCPDCRRILERTRIAHQMIGLKRYEQPLPEATERCLLSLHQQLVEFEQNRHLLDEDDMPVLTGWRYGWAAALVAVLAFNLMAARQVPSLQSSVSASNSPYQSLPTIFLASSNQQFRFEAPVPLLAPQTPAGWESSGRQSILTSYER